MNERILELSDQCTSYNDSEGWVFGKQKFAELIVRECIDCAVWVGQVNTTPVEPINTAHAIKMRIEKHFGVEG